MHKQDQVISMDIQIVVTKEFHQLLDGLYKLGGKNRRIHNNVRGLLAGVDIVGARAFKQLRLTNHGESRIKSCVKYDLGQGFRLVTVHKEKIIWLLYVGNHDASLSWLKQNSGWSPVRTIDGEIRVVRETNADATPEYNRNIVSGKQKLLDRFDDKSYYLKFISLLPPLAVLSIVKFDGDVSPQDLSNLNSLIENTKLAICIQDVLHSLIEDNKICAQDRIDLHLGLAIRDSEWSDQDYVQVSMGDEFHSLKIGSEEYEKALNHMATKGTGLDWLLFMHPEQTKIVEKDYIGPVQVSGVSGSGKTCVALKRAIRLADQDPAAKILFVSLNKSLVGLLKKLLALSAPSKNIERRITVLSMFELCQHLIVDPGKKDPRYYGELSDVLEEDIDQVFREFYRCWVNNNDAKALLNVHKMLLSNSIDAELYIKEEFDWIRSALGPNKRKRYIEMPRTGRKFPLQKKARSELLGSLDLWEKKMRDVGIIDYLGLSSAVSKFENLVQPSFQHIIVDEAQDFGTTELSILRQLSMEGRNNIFLCGDIAQSVLPKHRSLKAAGIHLKGGREQLKKNYRNTRQILEVAYKVLLNNLPEDQFGTAEDSMEILKPQYANRSLNAPLLLKANNLSDELTYSKKLMEELALGNENHSGCIVVAGYKQSEIKRFAESCGLRALDGNLDPFAEQIVVSDIEQSKGYEFDTVILVNCCHGVLPPTGIPSDELYRIACQIYVSMTRAKNDLYLSYHGEPSKWLVNVENLHSTLWSEVDTIEGLEPVPTPKKLDEIYEPSEKMDIFESMTGEQYIYSKFAIGLEVEHQDKIISLIDGRGMISSQTRENIKWRNIKSAISSIETSANARKIFGADICRNLLSSKNLQ